MCPPTLPDQYERVPVFSPRGERVGFLARSQAEALVASGEARALGTKRKPMLSIRLAHEPTKRSQYRRRPQHGDAHRRETYTNPRGTWTLDYMPAHTRPVFCAVLLSTLTEPPSA